MKTTNKPVVQGSYGTMYYVADMKKSVEFFKAKLGLKPSFEDPNWVEFRQGEHALCLHLKEGAHNAHPHGQLILRVEGIGELVASLKAAGVKVQEPHEVHPGAWASEFVDPDGNVVGIYEET